jgi:hypothetical protein
VAFKIGDLELGTPGDVIVGGLTYGTAFAIDAFFFTGGAASAEVAGAAAAAALGAKYAIQESWRRWRGKPPKEPPKSNDEGAEAP